ncbi:16S rRNA (cytidine(1402)-2'-O)-methyltransferase [Candidatus Pelagibacter sp.]|nr:16S rRNA (cytidine(1402)-2'-O)-methyltransferase [Candidatus Pelagibacter sp.]
MYNFEINDILKPGLYCVSTPIGNLGDMTFRAIDILNKSHLILSEDTRVSSKLLSKFNIKTKLLPNHKFNEKKNVKNVLNLLKQNKIISIISDAGTPTISDPGGILINECIKSKIDIFPVPGSSAATAAVSISGFSNNFFFCGFLPDKKLQIDQLFQKICNLNYSIVFFISPKKIKKVTAQIQKYFNDRDILITREMTKFHEEYIRDKVKNLNNINIFEKGEITVVISENSNLQNRLQVIEESVKKKIVKLLKKMSIKDITSKISKENNISKKIVYDFCLNKKNEN